MPIAALALAACAQREPVLAAIPDDTAWAAAVYFDANGAKLDATALLPRTDSGAFDGELEHIDAATSVRLLGWTADAFHGVALPDRALLAATPLELAQPGQPALPRPTFVAFGPRGGALTAAATKRAELTASWLPRCTVPFDPAEPLLVDTSCSPDVCDGTVEVLGCALRVDSGTCNLGTLTGAIDGERNITLGNAEIQCTGSLSRTSDGSRISTQCSGPRARSGCRLDLVPRVSPPRVKSESLAVLQVAPFTGNPGSVPEEGYLGGLAAIEGRLVVLTSDGVTRNRNCAPPAVSSRFVFVDPVSFTVSGSATSTECVTLIERDPTSTGFVGTVRTSLGFSIARWDRDGVRLTEKRAPVPGPAAYAAALHLREGSLRVLSSGGVRSPLPSEVLAIDPFTLEVTQRSEGAMEGADLAIEDTKDDILTNHDEVVVFEAEGGSTKLTVPIGLTCGVQQPTTARLFWDRRSATVVVTAAGDGADILMLSPLSGCKQATYYEGSVRPYALAPWPSQDGVMIVGVRSDDNRARVALLDVGGGRFLPGSTPVGEGIVGAFTAIGTTVYATLPWTGRIVRLTPVP